VVSNVPTHKIITSFVEKWTVASSFINVAEYDNYPTKDNTIRTDCSKSAGTGIRRDQA
jgi:hypothetical protein